MRKKIILLFLFIISLLPMLMNQYGGAKGVQEITGLVNLLNPIGIIATIVFIIGIWIPFKDKKINKMLGSIGVIGIVLSEIYKFLTWYIPNYKNSINIQYSFNNVFPEFYIGLVFSITMIIVYFVIDKRLLDK